MRDPKELWWRIPVALVLTFNLFDAALTPGNAPGKFFYCAFMLAILLVVILGFFKSSAPRVRRH